MSKEEEKKKSPGLIDIFTDLIQGRPKENAAKDRKMKFQTGEISCSDLTEAEKKKPWAASCRTKEAPSPKGSLEKALTDK